MVDQDTAAFNQIMTAFNLPKGSDEEKAARSEAIQAATKNAMEIPFRVMQSAYASMKVIKAMAEIGNPNSVSDAGVAALCARTAVLGAFLNVKINASGCKDKAFVDQMIGEGAELERSANVLEGEILGVVNGKIG